MNNDPVPFLDLVAAHANIKDQLMAVLDDAVSSGHFVGGAAVEAFEKEYASYCGSSYCVGVNSGTDALRFALIAAAIPPGSLVLTVPNTFIATTEAITQAGALPAFIDVDERTHTMDPRAVEKFLDHECRYNESQGQTTHRKSARVVSALLPVHLYGQMADMDALRDIADAQGLLVLEDACQAHGADYFSQRSNGWSRAGTMSVAAAFSFYPGKNLGALGEGGAVTTDDAAVADTIRMLREHGSATKYYHPIEGYNGRLDALQAGFLSKKLPLLQGWNDARRQCAHRYNKMLGSIPGIVTPFEPAGSRGNYHLYVIQADRRDELQQHVTEHGIGTGLHYPLPLHLQEAYCHLGYSEGDFPVAEAASKRILSLPMFPALVKEQQERVVKSILQFAESRTEIPQPV